MPGLYSFLKSYCRIALWFYYRKWQVHRHEATPGGPVIFVANHQNAFLDAVLVGCSTSRQPWFLARANVFQKPWARVVLTWLKMRPVFRFRDGFSTLRKNDEMIEGCVDLLRQGESILIFAEGNHDHRWHLRPLQKGFARIAQAAIKKNIAVKIVPVGLQYDSLNQAGSRVLVSFGKSISLTENPSSQKEEKEQIDLLIAKTSASLQSMMLHIEASHYAHDANVFLQNRKLKTDLIEQLHADQQLIRTLTSAGETENSTSITATHNNLRWLNPIFLYYVVNHALPRAILQWILKNKVKDEQFIGSLKFAIGMLLVPLFYLLQTGVIYSLSHSPAIALAYLISLPASLLLARGQLPTA
ncbi:MAG: 1-acyl-sn-glycerol-3-phosphate acyltransferase [Cyclobacteriaceae bacterium]